MGANDRMGTGTSTGGAGAPPASGSSGTALAPRERENAALGDRETWVLRRDGAGIAAVKGVITLSEAKGHLYDVQGSVAPTAAGYLELNRLAGLSILTPDGLTMPDGRKVVNPYPLAHPVTGRITQVWCKKVCLGYGPTGNLVVTSSTLLYDCDLYLLEDLFKKVAANSKAGRIADHDSLSAEERASKLVLRITDTLSLVGEPQNPDVIQVVGTYIQRLKFAERLAQTICERNALKHHPALAFSKVLASGAKPQRTARLEVVGWTREITREEQMRLAEMAQAGQHIDNADIIDIRESASSEDEAASTGEVGDEGSGDGPGQDGEPAGAPPPALGAGASSRSLTDLLGGGQQRESTPVRQQTGVL